MQPNLVDSRVQQLVLWIDSLDQSLNALKLYPSHLLETGVPSVVVGGKRKKFGVRTFAWAVEAGHRLVNRPYERSLVDADARSDARILAGALAHFNYRKRRLDALKKKNDAFWLLSGYRLFALLRIRALASGTDTAMCDKEMREYRDGIGKSDEVRSGKYTKLDGAHCLYGAYWATEADRLAVANPSESVVGRVAPWSDISSYSQRVLRDELAAFHCERSMMNHMSLAIAAALGARLSSDSVQRLTKQSMLGKQLAHACGVLMSEPREFVQSRLVQVTKDLGFLHNLPWEELYVACGDIPPAFWPDCPTVVGSLLNWIAPRITHIEDTKGGAVCGLIEESAPEYPSAAPAFTCFAVCLLDAVRRGLQQKLENVLVENLSKLSPRADRLHQSKGLSLDDSRLVDTEEGVIAALRRLYTAPTGRDIQDLPSKNSILLFGPPGTGKTSVATGLVAYLNKQNIADVLYGEKKWTFIEIDPHALLVSEDYSELVVHIRHTLDALKRVWKCVVFFDESEELLRSRLTDEDRIGRLFTSSMLPFLTDLQERGNIYIFATNYISDMDEAAIRVGRFAVKRGCSVVNLAAAKAKFDPAVWTTVKKYVARCPPKVFLDLCAAGSKGGETLSAAEWEAVFVGSPRLLSMSHLKDHIGAVSMHDDNRGALRKIEELLRSELTPVTQ